MRFFLTATTCLLLSCATGGSGDTSTGDDGGAGDDSSTSGDSPVSDGKASDGGPGGDGGGTPLAKACGDNATKYCMQLATCANFLLQTQYGDMTTCFARVQAACMDVVQAPGTGWTGDKLEACVAARSQLACSDFLHGKPAPNACRVTGLVTNTACRYDAQCGTGYCRIPSGMTCGSCVPLGTTQSPCTTSSDCDSNLVCAGSTGNLTCLPPSGLGATCDATHPCQLGLFCAKAGSQTTCASPGMLGATCDPANGGADCDYDQGLYCDSGSKTCKTLPTPIPGQSCTPGSSVCLGGATCFMGTCVAPAMDNGSCDPMQGENCMYPQSCQGGTCALFSASQCK